MAITPKPPGTISPPNTVAPKTAGAVAVPVVLSPETAGAVSIPNTLTAKAAGNVVVPNTLTSETAGTVAIPNTLTSEAAGAVAVPNALPAVAPAAFPRTLVPLLDLNYAHNAFSQSGQAKEASDLITYSRNSNGTFLDRFMDSNGDWNYFVNTDFVGSFGNSFLYTEQFDNAAWTKGNSSITANNTKDPLNGLTADKMQSATTSTTNPSVNQSITSVAASVYTVNIHAKKSESLFVQVLFAAGHVANNPRVNFDLSTGVIGSQDADIDSASIIPVGNGWFRISVTVIASGTSLDAFFMQQKTAAATRSLSNPWVQGEGLFIWGANIAQSKVIGPYVKAVGTTPNTVFTESQRIEYDAATGENLGALIESASTNLMLRSEEFDNGVWVKGVSSVVANSTLSPGNATNADKMSANTTGTNSPILVQDVTTVASSVYTVSTYIKKSEVRFIQIHFLSGHVASDPRVNFDLSTGVIGSQDANIESASIIPVGNGWFRISATVTAAGTALRSTFLLIKAATDTRNQTNSWTAGEGLFLWGAQIEQQGAPTSYIRTEGSTVSRLADLVSVPTAGNVPNSDVTFFADVAIIKRDELSQIMRIEADSNFILLTVDSLGDLKAAKGSILFTVVGDSALPEVFTVASVFDSSANTLTGFVDGVVKINVDAGGIAKPKSSGVIGIGNASPVAADQLNGHIKRLTIYDKALTAQEVALL